MGKDKGLKRAYQVIYFEDEDIEIKFKKKIMHNFSVRAKFTGRLKFTEIMGKKKISVDSMSMRFPRWERVGGDIEFEAKFHNKIKGV